jgi:hypothetical protein
MSDVHVLLVFDLVEQHLTRQDVFSDHDRAFDAYLKAEAEHRWDTSVEIVLLTADSLDTIRKTHGSYFLDPTESALLDVNDLLATT